MDSSLDFIDLRSRDTAAVVCRRHITLLSIKSLTDNQGGRPSNVVSGCATGVRLSVLLPLLGLLLQWQKLAAQPYGKFL
jgi:hypothetical protein